MSIRETINVTDIVIGPRIRRPLPVRVKALAESIEKNGQDTPIEVVRIKKGFELVVGGHRLNAIKLLDRPKIDAEIFTEDELATKHERRLREIRENMERFELNALERAASVAAWRESYEAIHGQVRRGGDRRSKAVKSGNLEDQSAEFALWFSDAAQAVFQLSRRSIFDALKIASIAPEIRDRLADYPIAENQSELLGLAKADQEHHSKICDLLTADDETAVKSVAEAIAIVTKAPKPKPVKA